MRQSTLKYLALVVVLVETTASAVFGSNFLVTNWRSDEGLPHSYVNSVVQTRDGYLWIGTSVGLVSFDGVRFVQHFMQELPDLGSLDISKLFEDREGVLWIGLETGRLIAWKDGMARVHFAGGTNSDLAVAAMAQAPDGTIWLQTVGGRLGKLTREGVDFVAITGRTPKTSSLGLVVDGKGNLWVGTSDGLKVWAGDRLDAPPGLRSLAGRPVDALAPAPDGSMWIFQDGRLTKMRGGEIVRETEAPPQFNGVAREILEASDHKVWVAAEDNRLFYLDTTGVWQVISDEPGLRGANRTIYEDREGCLWRGSGGGGLSRLTPKLFTTYQAPSSTFNSYARSVCSDTESNVWALLNSLTLVQIPAGMQKPQFLPGPSNQPPMEALFKDRYDTLWVGAEDNKLYRLQNGVFVCDLQPDGPGDGVKALFEDGQSNFWAGFGGAGLWVTPQGSRSNWRPVAGLPYPEVCAIAEGEDGAMWFGTHYGGVCRLKEGRWNRFTIHDGLPSDYVRCLHSDTDGTLWLGTLRGLCRWRDGKFITITVKDGLYNDNISSITEDGRSNYWISSFGGLFRVARQDLNEFCEGRLASLQCIGYDRRDGLPCQECPGGFQPVATRSSDGRLWFPTVEGLVSFAPDEILENPLPPPVSVEELLVDNNTYQLNGLTTNIEVGPGKSRLEWHFTALSLAAPEKIRFRHKLEGVDSDWSRPDSQRSAVYNLVPPGHYTFRLVACNNDGVWNTTGTAISMVVRPFFWQTRWFRGLALAGLVGLAGCFAWFVAQRKMQRKLEITERSLALERERSRIAKDIHDDLGSNLTRIMLLGQRAERDLAESKEVSGYLTKIINFSRGTIQAMDEIVWAINPRNDNLDGLVGYLNEFAAQCFQDTGIRCRLRMPISSQLTLPTEVRHDLFLAFKEALNNVLKHSKASVVQVEIRYSGSTVNIIVDDNGCGFDLASSQGNGLQNMRKRMNALGGQMEIITVPGHGTKVQFAVQVPAQPPSSQNFAV
jgi:signal transduction histidine kinase/ligand-binding sensor domain-containing protein